MFVPLHCLNFGVGGDETQHVLWRLQNGELEDFAPKVLLLLVFESSCCYWPRVVGVVVWVELLLVLRDFLVLLFSDCCYGTGGGVLLLKL